MRNNGEIKHWSGMIDWYETHDINECVLSLSTTVGGMNLKKFGLKK